MHPIKKLLEPCKSYGEIIDVLRSVSVDDLGAYVQVVSTAKQFINISMRDETILKIAHSQLALHMGFDDPDQEQIKEEE